MSRISGRVWAAGALCGAVLLTACPKGNGQAIEATLVIEPGAQSTCFKLAAQTGNGPEADTQAFLRTDAGSYDVAIYPSSSLSGTITVWARGYLGANCEVEVEQSAPGTATFNSIIGHVTVTLGPTPCEAQGCGTPPGSCYVGTGACVFDAGCTYRPADAGAACPDDGNPCTADLCDGQGTCRHTALNAGTPCPDDGNPCTSDTCNTGGVCVHPVLDAGTSCGGGTSCMSGGTCDSNGTCQNGMSQVCNTPPGPCFTDAGTCVGGVGCTYPVKPTIACPTGDLCSINGHCQTDGGCLGTPVTCTQSPGQCFSDAGSCRGGVCQYPVLGGACDTRDLCLPSGQCQADGGCSGTPVMCGVAPGECFSDAGSCTAGVCSYPVTLSASCALTDLCQTGGSCQQDGGCSGSPVVCNQPQNPCLSDAGVCNGGACSYSPLNDGTACNTAGPCETGQTCTAGACDGGSPVTCAAQDCMVGTCAPATGVCGYLPVAEGTACSIGVCSANGICHVTFGYSPSNFDAGAISTIAPDLVVDCPVVFDSTPGAVNSGWCAFGALPPLTVISQSSAPDASVLAMAGLYVTDGGSLTFLGSQPVILAVFGNVTVEGSIGASAVGPDGGSAGYVPPACNAAAGGTGTGGGGGGGGEQQAGLRGGNGPGAGRGGGGAASANIAGVPLEGGCPGAAGGAPSGSPAGGSGGAGGGTIRISAAGTMVIDGGVWSEGGGGGGGVAGAPAGGGGGGSGGNLVLEAGNLFLGPRATITANGGGGGQGAKTGVNGGAGQDGLPTRDNQAAAGGNAGGAGAPGGNGGLKGTIPTAGGGGDMNNGGGGGGGGAGHVRLNRPTSQVMPGAVVSPTPSCSGAAPCP